MASIFAEAERATDRSPTPPTTGYRACSICAERRPSSEVADRPAKFKAIVVDPNGDGAYPAGDAGYRTITRCNDATRCRAAVESFGESWPLDDRTPAPLPTVVKTDADYAFSMPAVEVAPDPAPSIGPELSAQASPDEDLF